MGAILIDIQLTVEVKGSEMIAFLCFKNADSKKIYLDEQTICFDNRVRGNYFKVNDEQGEKVDYIGMFVSREIRPELFVTLNPTEKIETNISLNEVYEIQRGKKYTIQYSTYHPSYLQEQHFAKIESNKVEITY
jgi:hypothetical protein